MSQYKQTSAQPTINLKRHPDDAHKLVYSTRRITQHLLKDITASLKSIDTHGSVEIYVQDSTVTQITVRNIKKTNGFAHPSSTIPL
jgi:hypothetical protein